jgi:signal transduction histidine kinase/putative methionine-R-sulfoxide reductase with GAF domain
MSTTDKTPTEGAPDTQDVLGNRSEAYALLSQVARSISSLELSKVLDQIVQAATTLTQAEEGMLMLPDERGETLYLEAQTGIDEERIRTFRIKSTEQHVGSVYRTGEPVRIADSTTERLTRVNTTYFTRSLLFVPMKYQERVIGVLGVLSRTASIAFSAGDQEVLLDLAAHAAVAIVNARLYEDSMRQNHIQSTLLQAGKALNATLDLQDVLLTVCRQSLQAFNIGICLIDRVDGDKFYPLARVRQAVWPLDAAPYISFEERPRLRQAIEKNFFYVVEADLSGTEWLGEIKQLRYSRAARLLVLPLRFANQPPLGAIELYYQGEIPEVGSEFRSQIRTVALEIYRHLFATPNQPNQIAIGNFGPLAEQILAISKAAWFQFILRDPHKPEQGALRMVDHGSGLFLGGRVTQTLTPEFAQLFHNYDVINEVKNSPALSDDSQKLMRRFGALAMLSLPITIKGRPFGIFTIFNTLQKRPFRADEIRLAWALITQAATALDNARLYSDLAQSLTDLKKAQAKLVQAARLSTIGQLAAVVAHQINNPLTTIIADSDLILQDMPPAHPDREALQAINRAGQRASIVVNRLLTTARSDSQAQPSRVALHNTITAARNLIGTYIERTGIEIKIAFSPDDIEVMAVPGHLEDVWLNLLINSRDALLGQSNGQIVLQTTRHASTAEILVWDNGPGIPSHLHNNIFEPFFTTKPVGEGTGLGLYVCQHVISSCRGRIRLSNPPSGKGACFNIVLPLAPPL